MITGCFMQLIGLLVVLVGGVTLNLLTVIFGFLLLFVGGRMGRRAALKSMARNQERLREMDRQFREETDHIDDDIIDAEYEVLDDDE